MEILFIMVFVLVILGLALWSLLRQDR